MFGNFDCRVAIIYWYAADWYVAALPLMLCPSTSTMVLLLLILEGWQAESTPPGVNSATNGVQTQDPRIPSQPLYTISQQQAIMKIPSYKTCQKCMNEVFFKKENTFLSFLFFFFTYTDLFKEWLSVWMVRLEYFSTCWHLAILRTVYLGIMLSMRNTDQIQLMATFCIWQGTESIFYKHDQVLFWQNIL